MTPLSSRLLVSSLVLGVLGTDDWRSCVDHFDAFMIQDVSETFHSNMESAVQLMTTWIDGIQSSYPQSRFGYATFTDKPIPVSGFGPYGGWQNAGIVYDWCFSVEQPLVNDKETFASSLRQVWNKRGSGFDWLESQLEAVVRGATNAHVGWESGDRNIRTIILITDEASHLEGDAAANIDLYNAPVTLVSAARMETAGGWGSHGLATGSVSDVIASNKKDDYMTLATYLARKTWHPSGITPDQEEELTHLMEHFGPQVYPQVVPHPGDDSLSCDEVDYPSGEVVARVLKEKGIIPIVLVIGAQEGEHCSTGGGDLVALQNCPLTFYREWMRINGLEGIVRVFPEDHEEAAKTLIQAVEDTAAIVCPTTTSTSTLPTTTTTTTPEPTTTTTTTTTEPTTTTTTTTTEPTTTTTTTTTPEPTTTTTTTTTEPTTTTTTTTPEPTTTTTTTTTPEPTTTTTTTTTPEPTTTTTTTTTEPTTTTTTSTTPKPTTTTTTTTTPEPTTTTTTTTPEPTTTTTTTTTTESKTTTPTTTTQVTTTIKTTAEPTTTTTLTTTTTAPATTETKKLTTTTATTSVAPETSTTISPEATTPGSSETASQTSTTSTKFLGTDNGVVPPPMPGTSTSTTTTTTTTSDDSGVAIAAIASAAGGAVAVGAAAVWFAASPSSLTATAFSGAEAVTAAEGLGGEVAREATQTASMDMFA